jgi:DNA-binding PadR family transcriptional regulator
MDWGLLMLASEDGKSGRTLRIFRITPRGQAMFGRTRWGRRKN